MVQQLYLYGRVIQSSSSSTLPYDPVTLLVPTTVFLLKYKEMIERGKKLVEEQGVKEVERQRERNKLKRIGKLVIISGL